MTGYPSIDKPWLKYYTREQIEKPHPVPMTVYEYLLECTREHQAKNAIRFEGQHITYGKMLFRIERTADALVSAGIGENDVVVCYLPACPHEVYLFYACSKIGACVNFIKPMTSNEKICKILDGVDAPILFTCEMKRSDREYIQNHSCIKKVVNISDGEDDEWEYFWKVADRKAYLTSKDSAEAFFFAQTGGSTGKSKTVMVSNQALNNQVHEYVTTPLDFVAGDTWLRLWPIFSVSAAGGSFHMPLCTGMEMIIVRDLTKVSFDQILLKERPNHIAVVPSLMEDLMNSEAIKEADLSFVKMIGWGGAKLTGAFEEMLRAFLVSHKMGNCLYGGYGMTENTAGVAMRVNPETAVPGSVGIPQVKTVVGIFEREGIRELGYHEAGEVCVLSQNFMVGYYGDTKKSEELFRQHEDGSLWLHTGDLGYMDENGLLYMIDFKALERAVAYD